MSKMTREQAISKLQEEFDALMNDKDLDGSDWTADLRQALEMGIQALWDTELLELEDRYLIQHFGMTRKAIARVMWNAYRTVVMEVEGFAETIDPDHELLDGMFDGEEWDENGNLNLQVYQKAAFAIFKDIISFGTFYSGKTSAIEACQMAGIDGWEPLERSKE